MNRPSLQIISDNSSPLRQPIEVRAQRPHTYSGGGGPGGPDDMDRRIESLERTSADIRESMARMEGKVDAIDKHSATKADLIGMESRMVKWFVGTALAMTGLAVAISFGIARLIL